VEKESKTADVRQLAPEGNRPSSVIALAFIMEITIS
jgi:hypothetical protein